MKRAIQRKPFLRLLSALLIAALGLPSPAFALRPTIQDRVETGLEEALRPSPANRKEQSSDPAAVLSDRETGES